MTDITNNLPDRHKKLEHFATGLTRWLLDESDQSDWIKDFEKKCQEYVSNANQLDQIPSEKDKKQNALLAALPATTVYWLGIYTGMSWLVPGLALTAAGSILISKSVGAIFKAGKQARFFQTYLYYLIRMENADGIISDQELETLKAIIEFVPAGKEEKEQWLQAIKTPEAYKELKPATDISQEQKEKILAGCWGLALCDGIDTTEKETFLAFGKELDVSEEKLEAIKNDVNHRYKQHEKMVREILKTALVINPELRQEKSELSRLLPLLSIQHMSDKEAAEIAQEIIDSDADKLKIESDEYTSVAQILVAALLLAASKEMESDSIKEKALEISRDYDIADLIKPMLETATNSVSNIK